MHEGKITGTRAPMMSRRNVLLGGALLGTAALAHGMVPRRHYDLLGKGKLEDIVPTDVGPWKFYSKSGLVIPPSDQLSLATYSQLLTRVYTSNDRAPIMLLIAQSAGQDGMLQIHRPEFCYPAGGFRLSNSRVHTIGLPNHRDIPTRMLTATGVDRIEQILYWTRIGRDLPTSWAAQRISVAAANLRGEIPDAVMVRVSTISADPAAIAQADEFARNLINGLNPKARPVLLGAEAAATA